jgi:hypothetical protein
LTLDLVRESERRMTDYNPVTMRIYTHDEIKQSILILQGMHEACNRGDIDQHSSPALLMAIDALNAKLQERTYGECLLKECVR